jgi:hypothetical protein
MGIQRIEYFLDQVKSAPADGVVGVCAAEVDYLRSNYSLSAFRRALTTYRRAVRQMVDEKDVDEIVGYMTLNKEESGALAIAKEKQISKDLLNQRPINDIDIYIMKAAELLDSSSQHDKVIGLAALTGRRMAEIGCTAKFERIAGDDTHVLFTGQLKMKGRSDQSAYTIPVLGNVDKIIKTLAHVHEAKPVYLDNTIRFHNACSKELGRKTKKLFEGVSDSPLSPKDLRSIYAEISYALDDDKRVAKQKFFSQVLGHGEDDNSTGVSYLDFYIVD